MAELPGPPPTAPPPQEPPPPPDQQQPADNRDERMWAMLCHLTALAGFVIPFGNIIGPLVVWLIKREEYPLVEDQGKESLNFQITIMIGAIVCAILALVVIGFLLGLALLVFNLVMVIIATIRANNGERYRYPFAIRFIK